MVSLGSSWRRFIVIKRPLLIIPSVVFRANRADNRRETWVVVVMNKEDDLEKLERLLKIGKTPEDRLFLVERFVMNRLKSRRSMSKPQPKRPHLRVIAGGRLHRR